MGTDSTDLTVKCPDFGTNLTLMLCLFYQEALKEFSFSNTAELSGILQSTFSSSVLTKAKLEQIILTLNANPMAVFMAQFFALNLVKLHLSSINLLEEDLLSMILHWEVASGKIAIEPELLELKKLCKDKTLFLNLGYGPLIDQENSITEWLTRAKELNVFRDAVFKMIKDFKGTSTQKLETMFYLTRLKADNVHTLILKVIQLLDKISGNKEMLKKFQNGKFHQIDKQIESIFKNEPAVKTIFEKLKASKNLEADIANLMLKISDESSSELFRVNSCAKCGYKLFQNNERDKNEGIGLILLEISNGRYLEVSFCQS
jgi:hypothetical protein